ncbi:MAG: LPS assembly lipoprotein LptE [Phycisphaerales bacterium]
MRRSVTRVLARIDGRDAHATERAPCARVLAGASAAMVTVLAGVGTGCSSDPTRGYSFASTRSEQVRTVAVPIFDNQTFHHGLEADLTDAIIKEIQRTTRWVVVPTEKAQTTLTGSITSAELRQLSTSSSTGLVQEVGMELSADFDWRDARTGTFLVRRRGVKSLESFVASRPTNERIDLGRHASAQELARVIVSELRAAW